MSSSGPKRPDWTGLLIAIACGLAFMGTALFLCVMPMVRHLAGARDYVVYWATGQQLIHHANPYDPAVMGALERAAGYAGKPGSYYMRNPPWALPLAAPLGWLGPRAAALPWSLLMLGLLIVSVRMLWTMMGKPRGPAQMLACAFPPALICVVMGQTSLFLLFGLVVFLRFWRTRPFVAGMGLWFCTLKPHLLLAFGVVLLAWVVATRSYRVLLGAAAALALSCAVTLGLDPQAFAQYAEWARHSGISSEFIPCFAVVLRNLADPAAKWLVFAPAVAACVWAVWYYVRHRREWDWLEHGSLLVLVSLLAAPYCWIYDQSLALPALFVSAVRAESRKLLAIPAIIYLALEIQPSYTPGLHSAWYLWPAPMWIVWYLVTRPRPVRLTAEAREPVPSAG